MDWARSRKWTVIGILSAVVFAFLLILAFAIFYKTPTCFDRKENGSETGIDCGGSCSTVCSTAAQPATAQFARILNQSGRQDLIAYINNSNKDSYAKNARATITLYTDDGHELVKHAILSLPADSATPLFIPGIAQNTVRQAFVSFDANEPLWTKGTGWNMPAPKVSNISTDSVGIGERVSATITNQTAYPENNVPLIAIVLAADGSVIAASQTILSALPAQGTAQAVFTWNEPFSEPDPLVRIVPLLALPQFVP